MALPNLTTTSANQSAGADTIVIDSFPEHVSGISIKRLMYGGSGWTGKLICEYQPCFGSSKHLPIGYNENLLTTVNYQHTVMHNRGCDINFIDFYGTNGDAFNLKTADTVYLDLFNRGNYALKMGILEDEDAYKYFCQNNYTTTCIEGVLKADMDHVYNTYIQPGKNVYWQDGGANVVGFFGGCDGALICPGDWETIWSDVENYVNNPPQSYNMKFVFQYGSFNSPLGAHTDGSFASPSLSAGAFAWPQPYIGANCTNNNPPNCFVSLPPSQDYWCDATGIACTGVNGAYLDRFYAEGWAASGKITIGLLYAGFDDTNTNLSPGWGKDRVISQRCGQTLLDTANEVTKGGNWGTTREIPYMQLVTWNDYEEGTEMESGVDNCYSTVALTLTPGSSTMNWTLGTQNDPNGEAVLDNKSTIHHYVVWTTGPGGTSLTNRKQLWHGATSFNLSSLGLTPGATYDVYVEMIGQPSMQNEMSNKVTYTQK